MGASSGWQLLGRSTPPTLRPRRASDPEQQDDADREATDHEDRDRKNGDNEPRERASEKHERHGRENANEDLDDSATVMRTNLLAHDALDLGPLLIDGQRGHDASPERREAPADSTGEESAGAVARDSSSALSGATGASSNTLAGTSISAASSVSSVTLNSTSPVSRREIACCEMPRCTAADSCEIFRSRRFSRTFTATRSASVSLDMP